MHQMSHHIARHFREQYLDRFADTDLRILEVGAWTSSPIESTYRGAFANPRWTFVGVDLHPGPNVDIVLSHAYRWLEIPAGTIDVVVSGQTFEHIQHIWLSIYEVARILKPGGIALLIAPSRGQRHWGPKDCWRIYPDGFETLASYAMLTKVEAFALWEPYFPNNKLTAWGDCVLIAQKPHDFDALEFSARYRGVQRSLGPGGNMPTIERGHMSPLPDSFDPKKVNLAWDLRKRYGDRQPKRN